MIKKRLASGEPCEKCAQTEEMLRRRGLWERIDEVLWAIEGEDASPGAVLARRHRVTLAPFFVVRGEDGSETVFTSPLKLIRAHFSDAPRASAAEPGAPGAKVAAPAAESEAPAARSEAPAAGHEGPSEIDVTAVARELADAEPRDVLRWALERFGERCAIAFSGAEDVVLVDMAVRLGLPFRLLTLDTGRLHGETYVFLDDVRRRYGVEIEVHCPDAEELAALVAEQGTNGFYEHGHARCCAVRKVAPLRRALLAYEAWVTGQRRDQSPATRAALPVIQRDAAFRGRSGAPIKLNPLAAWSGEQVWDYIRRNDVPYNPLHDSGHASIGCQPCTRAVGPGEHERDGRWWWERAEARECGLHVAGDGI